LVHEKDLRIAHLGARRQKAMQERGEYIGGRPPYGFRNFDGALVEVPLEQDAIRQARELRAEGRTLRAVAAELADRGILSRAGKPFESTAINAMVAA
jgi:transposase-like protein